MGLAMDDLLRGAFEEAAIGMAIVSLEGVLVRVNQAMRVLLGRDDGELLGRTLGEHAHGDDAPELEAHARALILGHAQRCSDELRIVRSDASSVWCSLTCSIVHDAAGKPQCFVAQLCDISERKATEERLERYRLLAERARDVILFIALDGHIVEANDAAERTYGYSRDELLTMTIHDLRASDTLSLVRPQMIDADRIGILFETVHRKKDGSTFPVQVSSQGANGPNERLLLSIVRDVTDRKRLHDQLLHADRLVALGTLTASIVHEINNPLAYVMNNLELAQKRVRSPPDALALEELRSFLGDAREGIDRMRAIIHSTRALLRSEEQPFQQIDVRDVLEATIQMTWFEIRERARLVRDFGEVPKVAAMESQLSQVFLNLIINAVQAIPERDRDRQEIRIATRATPTGSVVVEVHDTGCGMPPAVLDHIFDPFFTTKPVGVGTGLGLSICQGIVTSMRGSITVESKVGSGSVFRITLPAAEARSAVLPREADEREPDEEPLERPKMNSETRLTGSSPPPPNEATARRARLSPLDALADAARRGKG